MRPKTFAGFRALELIKYSLRINTIAQTTYTHD